LLRSQSPSSRLMWGAWLSTPLIADIFADPALDLAKREALDLAALLRRLGEFKPARLEL